MQSAPGSLLRDCLSLHHILYGNCLQVNLIASFTRQRLTAGDALMLSECMQELCTGGGYTDSGD